MLIFPTVKNDGEVKIPAEAYFFSEEELKRMPMLKHGRYRITSDGLHQVRYRRDGYDKQFTAKDLKTVKEKFRQWVKEENARTVKTPTLKRAEKFADFIMTYFENVKKYNVSTETYKSQLSVAQRHIFPALGAYTLRELTPLRCQALLNKLLDEGKGRTAENVKTLLKEVLRYAIGENLIIQNPMQYVKIPRHVMQNGSALTLEEVHAFLSKLENSYYCKVFRLFLYTGIRRGELKSATFDGDFLTVANGKCRKGERQKYRKIPIAPELRPYVPLSEREISAYEKAMTRAFKLLCPEHHLYDLRHTFTTRCMECGISKHLVDVWTGHVNRSDMTTAVYTHFSVEFQLKEIEKLHF